MCPTNDLLFELNLMFKEEEIYERDKEWNILYKHDCVCKLNGEFFYKKI